MSDIDGPVGRLARDQHGALSLRQFVSLGGTPAQVRHRLADQRWLSPSRGVYVVAGAPETFKQRLMVAVLALGDSAVVSHRAAAWLWGISGGMSVPIEVTIPYQACQPRRPFLVHRSRDLELADITWIDGIPVTGLARTVLDMCAVAPDRARAVMWQAMRTHGLEWDQLLMTLIDHSRRGRPGLTRLRQLLDEHYGISAGDSATEDIAYQILVDSRRVPLPERLVPVTCADGVEITVDLGWPDLKALVEVYGVDHFRNERVAQIDIHRTNQIGLAGYELLVYSGTMLRRPDRFVSDVEAMLARQGWRTRPAS